MADLDELLALDAGQASQFDADAVFARVEAEVGRSAPVKELSTPWRQALLLCVFLGVGGAMLGLQGVRTDLDAAGWWQLCAWIAVLLGAGGLIGAQVLRPLHVHGPRWSLAAGGWMLAVGLGLSALLPGLALTPDPAGSFHRYCLGVTAAATFCMVLAVVALDRGEARAPWRLAGAAAASGLVAFAVQGVFCPIVEVSHLLVGHAGAGWMLGLSLGLFAEAVRRLR